MGTINLDYRSLFHHFECAALLYENSRIADIEEDFQNTLKKCIKARPSDYKEQPFYMRAMGTILRIICAFDVETEKKDEEKEMPIKIQSDLPVKEILEKENIL